MLLKRTYTTKMKRIYALIKPYGSRVSRLCLLELLRGSAVLAMAAAMTELIEPLLLGEKREAAPVFLALLLALLLRILAEYMAANEVSSLSLSVQGECRNKLHKSLCSRRTVEIESGRLLTLALETVESFDDVFRHVLPNLVSCVVLIPMLFVAMLILDPLTAGILLLTIPIAPILLYLIGRMTREGNADAWRQQNRLNEGFHELLKGITTFKIFGQLKSSMDRLRCLSETSSEAVLRVLQLAFISSFVLELITTLSIALIAVNVGIRLLSVGIDFFTAFFALMLAPEFYRPIRQVGISFHAGMKAREAAEALRAFEAGGRVSSKHIEQIRMPPSVQVDGVSFCYPDQASPVLKNISMTLEAGTTTVLAGTSGSGKSTLLALLAGLMEPQKGNITLDGLQISKMDEASFYRYVSYVPQEPYIFAASLRDNLTMFHSVDDEQIKGVLVEAGLESWVMSLPDGLDTELGGLQGNGISNGQTHRLGFARAILQDPYFLLMDEPTAGLDEAGEEQLLQALEKFCYRRTVLLTSHRKKTLEWSKRIILLDGGVLVGDVTYEELRKAGYYGHDS